MRIAHLIKNFNLGGVNVLVRDLSTACKTLGDDILIISLSDGSELSERFSREMLDVLQEAGIAVTFIPWRRDAGFVRDVNAAIGAFRPDLVHSHEGRFNLINRLMGLLHRYRSIRTIHNVDMYKERSRTFIGLAELLQRNMETVCVSSATLKLVESYRTMLPRACFNKRAGIISNAVPLPLPKARPPFSGKFAFFGRNSTQKGLDILAGAVRKLAGFDIEIHAFTERSGDFDVADLFAGCDNVVLHEPAPDARALMASYDGILIPSRFEGLPLIAIESLGQNIPAIMTRVAGLNECASAEYPYFARDVDAGEFAKVIGEFVKDAESGTSEAKCAPHFEAVRLRFSFEKMVSEYRSVYLEGTSLAGLSGTHAES